MAKKVAAPRGLELKLDSKDKLAAQQLQISLQQSMDRQTGYTGHAAILHPRVPLKNIDTNLRAMAKVANAFTLGKNSEAPNRIVPKKKIYYDKNMLEKFGPPPNDPNIEVVWGKAPSF